MTMKLMHAVEHAYDGDVHHDYSAATLARLWADLPEPFRLDQFGPADMPPDIAPALRIYQGARTARINVAQLPEPLRQEMAWAIWRVIDLGAIVPVAATSQIVTLLATATARPERQTLSSFMERPLGDWERWIKEARVRRTGRIQSAGSTNGLATEFRRFYTMLWFVYDTGPWWHRDVWFPRLDPRIPQRTHEPTMLSARWFDIEPGWLRDGVKWYCKTSLELGQLSWTTVARRPVYFREFGRFLIDRSIDGPALAATPTEVRVLMLDFLSWIRQLRGRHGPTKGATIGKAHQKHLMGAVESFYAFMEEYKDVAAHELGEPRWALLDAPHTRLWRRGEKPLIRGQADESNLIPAAAMSDLLKGADLLAKPLSEGGLGDEQAMRILLLLAKTGRRQSEIRMLDFDPLLPLSEVIDEQDGEALVAKLRYQQTKIDGAPDTIFIDAETVAIVNDQQRWGRERMAAAGRESTTPKYLFMALSQNRNGDRPYSWPVLYDRLAWLSEQLDVRDPNGKLVCFSKTHSFRHTRATSLINLGVPLHVVQRYLGHLSPKMTMHYAQTLDETHRREFLRFRKITADARELDLAPEDLYDMLELDKRTDRVLPNGLCMLPPRQICNRGNACLTCNKFVTDASYLSEHEEQRAALIELIERRHDAHRRRTGQPMSDGNIWKSERLKELRALDAIIAKLKHPDVGSRPVRGAGTSAQDEQAA